MFGCSRRMFGCSRRLFTSTVHVGRSSRPFTSAVHVGCLPRLFTSDVRLCTSAVHDGCSRRLFTPAVQVGCSVVPAALFTSDIRLLTTVIHVGCSWQILTEVGRRHYDARNVWHCHNDGAKRSKATRSKRSGQHNSLHLANETTHIQQQKLVNTETHQHHSIIKLRSPFPEKKL